MWFFFKSLVKINAATYTQSPKVERPCIQSSLSSLLSRAKNSFNKESFFSFRENLSPFLLLEEIFVEKPFPLRENRRREIFLSRKRLQRDVDGFHHWWEFKVQSLKCSCSFQFSGFVSSYKKFPLKAITRTPQRV